VATLTCFLTDITGNMCQLCLYFYSGWASFEDQVLLMIFLALFVLTCKVLDYLWLMSLCS